MANVDKRVVNVRALVRPIVNIMCVTSLVIFGFMILGGARIPNTGMEAEIFRTIIGLAVALPSEYAVERGVRHLAADRKKTKATGVK